MSENLISVLDVAATVAQQTGQSCQDVVAEWQRLGMVEALTRKLLEADSFAPEGATLDVDESQALALLFARTRAADFGAGEETRLNELLHRYRRYRVNETRALADWLALGGVQRQKSPVMQLTTLRSNMLYAAGYDAEKRMMDVIFNSGGVYRYYDVPPPIYAGLLKAPSVGRYMWDHVLRVYPHVRLDRKRKSRRAGARNLRTVDKAA